jgi:hypothetical protein
VLGTAPPDGRKQPISYSFNAPHYVQHTTNGFQFRYSSTSPRRSHDQSVLVFTMAQSGYSNPLKKFK